MFPWKIGPKEYMEYKYTAQLIEGNSYMVLFLYWLEHKNGEILIKDVWKLFWC